MVMFFGAFQVQHYSEPCLCRYHRPSTCQTDLDSKHSKLTRAVHGYAILVSLQHRAFRNLPVHHHFPTIKSLFPVYPSFRHTHIVFTKLSSSNYLPIPHSLSPSHLDQGSPKTPMASSAREGCGLQRNSHGHGKPRITQRQVSISLAPAQSMWDG